MKIFISYTHRDAIALERLHSHMSLLKRDGIIASWYDREILAGGDINKEISRQLASCDIFIALVSSDFFNSDYCYEVEMEQALARHDAGEIRIIPVIVRPCEWQSSPLKMLKALPKDGRPISEWKNEDTAYLDVVREIRRTIMSAATEPEDLIESGRISSIAPSKKLRVKKDYDKIDRGDFRDECFKAISDYFAESATELDSVDGVRCRFRDLGPTSFSCTILNQKMNHGEAHITIHSGSNSFGIGDITYSFKENAPSNTANGWLSIDSDEYDLYINWHGSGFSSSDNRVSIEMVAVSLWKEFSAIAGIAHE